MKLQSFWFGCCMCILYLGAWSVREVSGTIDRPFVAYNDLAWGPGQTVANVTRYTTDNGTGLFSRTSMGTLVDHVSNRRVAATLSVQGGVFSDHHVGKGVPAEMGTEAHEIFNDKIDLTGVLSYGQEPVLLTFSNLNPRLSYTVVLFGNRGVKAYADRLTKVTIHNIDAFENQSSSGAATALVPYDSTILAHGYNTEAGLVATYSFIDPGDDGRFEITVEGHGSIEAAKYYVNGLMLRAEQAPLPLEHVPIPELERWKRQMLEFGSLHCDLATILEHQRWEGGVWYYDGIRAYYNIAAFTGVDSWHECAQFVIESFRDGYVLDPAVLGVAGAVPGWRNFTHGLTMDYLHTRSPASREAVVLLAENAAFAGDLTPLSSTVDEAFSRPVAYAMISYINAELLGEPRRARLTSLLDQALGHIDQWFVQKSSPDWAPFMFGLTSEALLYYYEHIEEDEANRAGSSTGVGGDLERGMDS